MKLGVNIDHVATIRQARYTNYPDIVNAAKAAEQGGADFITVHLREDRRHITDSDLPRLKKNLATYMNLEIAMTSEMQDIALMLKPKWVCLVPERRRELTTEGGLQVVNRKVQIQSFCSPLKAAGIGVSLFIDVDEKSVLTACDIGVDAVEIHTGQYVRDGELKRLQVVSAQAKRLGLIVNAGHGLHYDNVRALGTLPFSDLNIGHAIVARALFVGLTTAVSQMKALMS